MQALVPYFSGLKADTKLESRSRQHAPGLPAAKRSAFLGHLSAPIPELGSGAEVGRHPQRGDFRAPAASEDADEFLQRQLQLCRRDLRGSRDHVGLRHSAEAGGALGPDVVAHATRLPHDPGDRRRPRLGTTPGARGHRDDPDGDGMSPFGVRTNIPCTAASGCDPAMGMVCSRDSWTSRSLHRLSGRAEGPGVDPARVQLLGHRVRATRVHAPFTGRGQRVTFVVETVDPNEPPTAWRPARRRAWPNPTHNRAHFRVAANEGAFYELRLYNHNGTFRTQQDGIEQAPPRVAHVCYAQSAVRQRAARTRPRLHQSDRDLSAGRHQVRRDLDDRAEKVEDCRHLPGPARALLRDAGVVRQPAPDAARRADAREPGRPRRFRSQGRADVRVPHDAAGRRLP